MYRADEESLRSTGNDHWFVRPVSIVSTFCELCEKSFLNKAAVVVLVVQPIVHEALKHGLPNSGVC